MFRTRYIGLAFALMSSAASAETLTGRANVIDGDTLDIHGERIRILDIDAPEFTQLCRLHASNNWKCGMHVALALYNWIGTRIVTCESDRLDRYKRHLARCAVDDQDVATWLAENGWAVPYRDCKCEVVRAAADRAKAARLGIWAGEFELPWDWRNAH